MKNVTALVSALVIATAAPFASAYSVIESELVKGEVVSVNAENREIVLKGNTAAIELPETAAIELNGQAADISAFAEGDKIKVKRTVVTPATASVSGQIVALNKAEKTASIRTKVGKVVKVRLEGDVKVSGMVQADSIEGLKKGYSVTIAAK